MHSIIRHTLSSHLPLMIPKLIRANQETNVGVCIVVPKILVSAHPDIRTEN